MSKDDKVIANLLELNDTKYVIDECLGLWVKFAVKLTEPSKERPHGIRYSFSLHDRTNKRLMGFDNAHAILYGKKKVVSPMRAHYHWHRNEYDKGSPYLHENAGKLLEDFWKEVEKVLKKLEGNSK